MKIIDRYTLRQVVVGFILVLASMTVLVWMTQSLRMMDMIVTKGVGVGVFLELTVLFVPYFLQILSPLALFAVVLFVLIRMQTDRELIVMQAVGMGPKDIMRPVFVLAVFLTIGSYLFSIFVVPMTHTQMREMKWKIRNDVSHLLLQEGQFNTIGKDLTLYIKERTHDGQVLGILAYEAKEKKSVLSAKSGRLFQEPDGIRVEFYNGVRQEYQPQSQKFSIMKFDKYTMNFAETGNSVARKPDVREMPLRELYGKTKEDVGQNGPLWRKHKVEMVKRLTYPLYNISFMFLVIFGVLSGHYNRRGQNRRIILTVGLAAIVQALTLAFEYAAAKNLWFLILVVLNIFSPILILCYRPRKKRRRHLKRLAMITGVMMISLTAGAGSLKMAPVHPEDPVDFEADQVSYDQKKEVLNASGNVVMIQGPMTVKTEEITFDRTANQIQAPGKIDIRMKDGTEAQTENGILSGDLKSMTTGKTHVRFYEGTYLGAETMERKPDGDSYLREATYTPCDVCEGEAPLWRLRSKNVWNDTQKHDMVFHHAFLDVKDVPVFYVPYWRMPDFTVKRRSGFLPPDFGSNREMGQSLTLPYFWDVADNQNLILTPTISLTHIPLGVVKYQGVFSKGTLNLTTSATRDDDDHHNEGHIRLNGVYDVNKNWRLSGELYKTATDTYFRRYNLKGVDDTEPFLTSHLTAERFGNRSFFRTKFYSYQSLKDNVSSHSIPVILPVADYQYNTAPLGKTGLYGFTKVNMMLFNTREKFMSNRLSLTQGVRLPYVLPIGIATETTGYVRADGYMVDPGRVPVSGQPANKSYNTGRLYPNLSVKMSYPMVKSDPQTTQTLEPIVQVVTASNGGNKSKIPNVDSLVFDFDDTDLFSTNRFSGYDRVETGTRVNYGIKWSRFNHQKQRSISALIGQSYRLNDDPLMTELMGYENHFSDYVGRVLIRVPYLDLLYSARLDQKTLKAQKNDVGVMVGQAPLKLGLSYVMRRAYTIGDNRYGNQEGITYRLTSALTKSLSLTGYYRYDLSGKKEPVDVGGTLKYENECMAVIVAIDKSYTRDRNYEGDVSFNLKLVLKTLGGV